jgi:hypothetical protein
MRGVLTLANLIWSSVSVLGSHSMDGIRPAASTLLLAGAIILLLSSTPSLLSTTAYRRTRRRSVQRIRRTYPIDRINTGD